jgi:DNA-binding NarL/FixJ family response regulator
MTITVVLAEDQRAVREGLAMLLRHLPGIELVAGVADGTEAIAAVRDHRPDVVLMDLRMPGVDGTEATRVIRERWPSTQVVVLTTYADDDSVFPALRAGARGYLTKDVGAEQIAQAISAVARGEAVLEPSVTARVLDVLRPAGLPALPDGDGPLADGVTKREAEVLRLIARGLSNRDIAETLVISEATVKTHVNRLLAKIGVRDRAQAVSYAYRVGLLRD